VDRRGSRPPLLFLHTSLPHVPWRYLPDGREYSAPTAGLEEGAWTGPQWQVDQAFQRHLLQTQYADRLLGRLLDRIRAAGWYERALVVVTADHGVAFRAGDRRRTPTPTNLHDVANMPLFVKTPGQREGRVVDGVVRTIDILPTIARELGVRLRGVDGVAAGERGTNPATALDVPDSWEGGSTGTYGEFLRQRASRRRHERRLLAGAGYDPFAIGPASGTGRAAAGGGRGERGTSAPGGHRRVGVRDDRRPCSRDRAGRDGRRPRGGDDAGRRRRPLRRPGARARARRRAGDPARGRI
jgi:hypothetical protein